MEDILEIMKAHLEKYPQMQPQDCLKLLHQHHYGPGHLISDPALSLSALKKEMAAVNEQGEQALLEPIGNHLCRVYLSKAKTCMTPSEINDLLVRTADIHRVSMADFMRDLKRLKSNITSMPVSFTQEEFDAVFAWYRSEGYPAIHHSHVYKEAYDPHYRVIYEGMIRSLQ